MKKNPLDLVAQSTPVQILITLLIYSFYATVMGISLAPSVALFTLCGRTVLGQGPGAGGILLLALALGAALYLYFITGVVVMGLMIRLLSLGIKPGRYPQVSLTMLRWLIYSGVYHMAGSTILNFIPMSWFGNLFFKLVGARIGRNVYINTWFLNDAYLLTLEDGVVIGGKTDVSCHTFEGGQLVLSPVRIGEGTLVGTHCYISPGVTIGKKSVIGQYAFIRKGRVLPERSRITALAGMDVRSAAMLENIREHLPARGTDDRMGKEPEGEKK